MFVTNRVIKLEKAAIEHRFSRLNQRSIKALGTIPKVFKYIIPQDIKYPIGSRAYDEKDIENTIHIFRSGILPKSRATTTKEVLLNVKVSNLFKGLEPSSTVLDGANWKFFVAVGDKKYLVGGFYNRISHLSVFNYNFNATEKDTVSTAALVLLEEDTLQIIRKIFEFVTKSKLGKIPSSLPKKYKIGSDVEFSIVKNGKILSAALILGGNTQTKLGNDGHQETGEIRPSPFFNPEDLIDKGILPLIKELSQKLPKDAIVTTGGGITSATPLGDHIHFGKILSQEEIVLLDLFVGEPTFNIKGAKRIDSGYGFCGDVRYKPHGCEYRTCSSGLIPSLIKSRYVTCFNLVKFWENMKVGDVLNISIIDDIPSLESYMSIVVYEHHRVLVREFFRWVTSGVINPKENFLHHWFPKLKPKLNKNGRVEIKTVPTWYTHSPLIPVKGLTERKFAELKTYSAKDIPNYNAEFEVKDTIMIEFPESTITVLEKNESKRNEIENIAKSLGVAIAVRINHDNIVAIMYPSTWRKKVNMLTPYVIRKIIRFGFENMGEEKCVE